MKTKTKLEADACTLRDWIGRKACYVSPNPHETSASRLVDVAVKGGRDLFGFTMNGEKIRLNGRILFNGYGDRIVP